MLISFDSLSRPALWLLLTRLGIPDKIVRLFRALYDHSVSCVRTGGIQSPWFNIESGVQQVCVLAPDSFVTGMDCLLEKTVGSGATLPCLVRPHLLTGILPTMSELLVPALELMAGEAASLRLGVNWQKTGATSVLFGQASFNDLDFADNVFLLAELLEHLVPALQLVAGEAASLGSR